MDLGLTGLRAVISGGTKGIGRAVAELLVEEGAAVAICARDGDAVAETTTALQARGGSAFGQALDVSNADDLKAWIGAAAGRWVASIL